MSLMTDPDEMRTYAQRFHGHADAIDQESKVAWASAQDISGAGWKGLAQNASFDTMGELMKAFRNIHDQMQFVSTNLSTSADHYHDQEVAGQNVLGGGAPHISSL
ncbi:WXG100 family type VII secretion target [Mycolicibacterium sp. BK556]|uniref:WXG100 family type VII secretion target n=1 Tax=Mycobacteriaceae TaxID=1762 RepID=UPI000D3C3DB7|nr:MULTISPECIES: WXG100 family type VII secretion target [Mycobacteriaceae]MBB3606412.1 WXG100 family type VII secretion target [Mycolicibacterium sp. BK556]MBB3636342.1 WXG100 family type VII secretion target [Mycolicibacterium sp. BK607]MBB3753647.1 WXG100 family type VII secretion target [Mycolicibacterium sp. BK634]TDO06496.1 WXG100 family type VII secretion target [Mycobacterium sp. BK086]